MAGRVETAEHRRSARRRGGSEINEDLVRVGIITQTKTWPVLPLRDMVFFPHIVVPLFVGREKAF